MCGTVDYFSPELLNRRGVTRAADIWAFGIFLFEISVGFTPFTGETRALHLQAIIAADMWSVKAGAYTPQLFGLT